MKRACSLNTNKDEYLTCEFHPAIKKTNYIRMKKVYAILTAVLLMVTVWAQSPEKMSYQAVLRNSSNNLVSNTQVGMKVSILQGTPDGTVVYTETHTPTTNANGLVTIEIGGGSKSWWLPLFDNINWSAGPYFIKTETDLAGGTNYSITGTSQVLSVPYALHAKTAETIVGTITEADPLFKSSVAGGITETETSFWTNKQNQLIAGRGIIISGNVISINEAAFEDDSVKGIAKYYLNDENIQYDPNVLFASGFENGFAGWSSYNTKVSEIIADPDSAFSGNRVLKTTATRGINTGGETDYKIQPEQTQIYLRFYTKLDKNTITPHHFVKIRAISAGASTSAGQKPLGDKAFWTGIEPLVDDTWNFYTYWHEMHSWQSWAGIPDGRPNPYYGNVFHPLNQTPFHKGEWVCVEAMLKANTPGQHDGEQAFWINGKKIGHWKTGEPLGEWRGDKFVINYGSNPQPFEGFNWRTSEDVKINEVALQWYISAEHFISKHATQDANSVYFDNIVVAKEYIGPMYDKNGPVLDKNH